jgi:hypothetical protein
MVTVRSPYYNEVRPASGEAPTADTLRANGLRVERVLGCIGGERHVVHAWGRALGLVNYRTCCGARRAGVVPAPPGAAPNCIHCVLCRGCVACRDGMITEATIAKGVWTTAKRGMVFPHEMDDQHLCNAIRKLERDEEDFKDDFDEWLEVFAAEAKLRGLTW